jgi:hypothetical protein
LTDFFADFDFGDFGAGLTFYGLRGEVISRDEWLRLWTPDMASPVGSRTRRVAGTVQDDVFVSTVWLGLDHGFGYTDRPLIFETMIFGGDYDGGEWRYSTLDEALEGHQRACVLAFGVNMGSGGGREG